MDYAALLQTASAATADTLPQTLQTLLPAMHAAALLDTEVEAILLALRTATRVPIRALRADWRKFVTTHTPPGAATSPGTSGGGTPMLFTDPEPWPTAVDGPGLLAELAALYTRYVVLPEGAADMLALWTLHTYAHAAAQTTPRVGIESPQPRCGKTTLMALLGAVTARPLPASNITPAALFRAIERWQPTMLIDEADTFLRDNDELRGVLNAGHTRATAYVIRTVGDDHEPRVFGVWAPIAIALIGKLPSTLADRALVVKMRRKLPREPVERLRLDRLPEADALRQRCLRWAQDVLPDLQATDPVIPDGLHDRAADNWRPLCAIAVVAGGPWPQRAVNAINALSPPELDDEAAGVMLLEDMWRMFSEKHLDRIPSAEVVAALHKIEERPWSEWGRQEKPITARQVARLLSPFGIKSKTIRVGADTPKGYEQEDFLDAMARYLPLVSATAPQVSNGAGFQPSPSATPSHVVSATTPHTSNGAGMPGALSATASNDAYVADTDTLIPLVQADCGVVADGDEHMVLDDTARIPASRNGCGAVADHHPSFETLRASHLWCATCQGSGSFRTLTQLDGTEVYLCNTCDTAVGHKRITGVSSPKGTPPSGPEGSDSLAEADSPVEDGYDEVVI